MTKTIDQVANDTADQQKDFDLIAINMELDEVAKDADDRFEALELLAGKLRRAIVAILSHSIRRQHLPGALTIDSALWDRLRDLDGDSACAAVSNEIQNVQSLLRRGGAE